MVETHFNSKENTLKVIICQSSLYALLLKMQLSWFLTGVCLHSSGGNGGKFIAKDGSYQRQESQGVNRGKRGGSCLYGSESQ